MTTRLFNGGINSFKQLRTELGNAIDTNVVHLLNSGYENRMCLFTDIEYVPEILQVLLTNTRYYTTEEEINQLFDFARSVTNSVADSVKDMSTFGSVITALTMLIVGDNREEIYSKIDEYYPPASLYNMIREDETLLVLSIKEVLDNYTINTTDASAEIRGEFTNILNGSDPLMYFIHIARLYTTAAMSDVIQKEHDSLNVNKDPAESVEYMHLRNELCYSFLELFSRLSPNNPEIVNHQICGKIAYEIVSYLHKYSNNSHIYRIVVKELVIAKIAYLKFAANRKTLQVAKLIESIFAPLCNNTTAQGYFNVTFPLIKIFLDNLAVFRAYTNFSNSSIINNPQIYMDFIIEEAVSVEPKTIATEASRKTREEPEEESEEDEKDQDEDDEESPKKKKDVDIDASQSNKGYKKRSVTQANAQKKIYAGYKKYKDSEQKIDSQLQKMLASAKSAFSGDKTEEILEGKKFSPIGLLKKVLATAAIFNFSKVAGFAYLLLGHTLNKKRTLKQRREIILELESEIKMLDEKIEDAKGDGNKKAKYALMRTKHELERTRDKIKFQVSATSKDISSAKNFLRGNKGEALDRADD